MPGDLPARNGGLVSDSEGEAGRGGGGGSGGSADQSSGRDATPTMQRVAISETQLTPRSPGGSPVSSVSSMSNLLRRNGTAPSIGASSYRSSRTAGLRQRIFRSRSLASRDDPIHAVSSDARPTLSERLYQWLLPSLAVMVSVKRVNKPRVRLTSELYWYVLNLNWFALFFFMAMAWLSVNIAFAVAYWYGCGADSVSNATNGFQSAFFLSVQTISTVGYGGLAPATLCADYVMVLESFVGLCFTAVSTGVLFAKYSSPSARVMWSKHAVVRMHDGKPTLFFRAANYRGEEVVAAHIECVLLKSTVSQEGSVMRKLFTLRLERDSHPLFVLGWTVMHVINPTSALYGESAETLRNGRMTLIVSLTGLDATFSQQVYDKTVYRFSDILWNHRFQDTVTRADPSDPHSQMVMDFGKFHSVVRIMPDDPDYIPEGIAMSTDAGAMRWERDSDGRPLTEAQLAARDAAAQRVGTAALSGSAGSTPRTGTDSSGSNARATGRPGRADAPSDDTVV